MPFFETTLSKKFYFLVIPLVLKLREIDGQIRSAALVEIMMD